MAYRVYNNKIKLNGEQVDAAVLADISQVAKDTVEAFKDTYVEKGSNISELNNDAGYVTGADLDLTTKVDKVEGKGLSTNDYTTEEKNKLAGIAAGAQPGTYSKPNSGIPKIDLASAVQTSLDKADTALQSFTEADPTVPSWAKAASKPTYTASEVGALASTVSHLSGDIAASEKGAANGVATLGSDSKIPAAQLPSYVDDVLEYSSKTNFPTTGESGKIYVDTATNLTYRWSGTAYVEISQSLALGETSSTAYAGNKGAANAAAISTHTGNGDIHVTAANKTAWGAKYDKPSGGIPKSDLASAVQTSLGKADSAVQDTNYKHITVTASSVSDGTTTFNKYAHPTTTAVTAAAAKVGKDASGHVVIGDALAKGDVGLGNVGNFKAVSTVASQGLTDTEKSNARANIGAGTSSFSGSYNDLSNKPTIPTVNNATLTIQKNGTTVKSFTANASSNVTANIIVPTKVSELTNDSGFTTSANLETLFREIVQETLDEQIGGVY